MAREIKIKIRVRKPNIKTDQNIRIFFVKGSNNQINPIASGFF